MVGKAIPKKKLDYRSRLERMLKDHQNILIVECDHVGSNQMQKIRIDLRGKALLLMGKNTVMRKVIRELAAENPALEKLLPYLVGNIGLVFCKAKVQEVRKIIMSNKVPAAARSGTIAPIDCIIPKGSTGLDPGQTSFFQVLNIATKIVRGSIEIISDVHLIKVGEKVTPSHVSLLSKLDIKPFFYGMKVVYVYENGSVYDASVLDLSEEELMGKFYNGVRTLACISLATRMTNLTSLPHLVAGGFKKLLAIAVTTDITFKEAESYKEFIANPEAFAAQAGAPAAEAKAEESKEEEKEEAEESEGDMGFSLFD